MFHRTKLTAALALVVLLNAVTAVNPASGAENRPYPPSPVIKNFVIEPERQSLGNGDNWPITWANDGDLYTVYCDGKGFGGSGQGSMNLAKVTGSPSNIAGENLVSPTGHKTGGGPEGRKASGLLMADGVLYMWVRNLNKDGTGSSLAWSKDRAKTWTWADWSFPEIGYPVWMNAGRNYEAAQDEYAYMYSPDSPSAYKTTDHILLARVSKGRIANKASYEFFAGIDENGKPRWNPDFKDRKPVFTDPGHCYRPEVVYNPGLKRYLLCTATSGSKQWCGTEEKYLGIFDAPHPWGPWTVVKQVNGWGSEENRFQPRIPAKWISQDGKSFYLLYSCFPKGRYQFNIQKVITQDGASTKLPGQGLFRQHLADYDSEFRLANGRVDIDAMVKRLKELGVTTYYWLVWHAATDWDDLKVFLPKASRAGIEVWVYLVPPSESPPQYGSQYSEPFRLDYGRWAEEIARLSLQHPNLTAWVIDDFYANHELFTPAYLRDLQTRSKGINPRLAFLPLMYPNEMRRKFVEDYRGVIDGVVVAYLQDRDDIERTWALLNDAALPPASELRFPWNTPSCAGDYGMASQSAKVLPANRYEVQFLERDDFIGPTAGYHYKQLLLDGTVVWEEDVAGESNSWHKVTVDLTQNVLGKTNVTLAFRLFDKRAVSNFGVHWRLAELRAENLQLAADLSKPQKWRLSERGAFEGGFGRATKSAQRRFHVPFVSMTAGDEYEFRLRHGDPATTDRIAQQLQVSLQAWRDGKCDGVVTYCLDKRPQSQAFPPVQKLFHEFRTKPTDR